MYNIIDTEVVKIGDEHWIEMRANSVHQLQDLALPLGLGAELKTKETRGLMVVYPVDGDITRVRMRVKKGEREEDGAKKQRTDFETRRTSV